MATLKLLFFILYLWWAIREAWANERLISPSKLEMFVDDLPDMPKIKGFTIRNGVPGSRSIKIGMFEKKWVKEESSALLIDTCTITGLGTRTHPWCSLVPSTCLYVRMILNCPSGGKYSGWDTYQKKGVYCYFFYISYLWYNRNGRFKQSSQRFTSNSHLRDLHIDHLDHLNMQPCGLHPTDRIGLGLIGKLYIGFLHPTVCILAKFHRDLPPTRVFAYGTSNETATVPGPTIEALQGIETRVRWKNHLPSEHILPWDPTIPTATVTKGVPTVVHLHGGIHEPESDGNSNAWFTAGFKQRGPSWSKKTYHYHNVQQPGNLWYHDHAMGLTRVNLLAGLIGSYVIRQPDIEDPLGLPSGPEFDRHLVIFDRSFRTDGSIYMNSTGNNPSIHPQWQPEYFGDAVIVNGKAWPRMKVGRRKYRFRILNASNARFFRFFFSNGMKFIHVASDSAYLARPVTVRKLLVAPSEIADVIVDFATSTSDAVILANDAPYPFPSGDSADEINGKVMKFIIDQNRTVDTSRVPPKLIEYPAPTEDDAVETRYIAMYEYTSATDEPTHLYLNGKAYEEPATETPKVGSTEVWYVINLTEDNHPLHIHLGLFVTLEQTELVRIEELKDCMMKINDPIKCNVSNHSRGKRIPVPAHERGWKNVYKMSPGAITKILVRFSLLQPNTPYPFNASAEPGYVYHCHILDHEDNAMMRPLKITS